MYAYRDVPRSTPDLQYEYAVTLYAYDQTAAEPLLIR